MSSKRVVAAMSGGVDSSVVAALLAKQGYEVIGITLRLWTPSPWRNGERYGGCCSVSDISDAKQVCHRLGIPHYTYNCEKQFKEKVVDNFISEYLAGKTPNPCIRCNAFIKFDILLKYAIALHADYLATGHYARIEKSDQFHLCKAQDLSKDQSYFLYMLNQKQLAKVLFPLGIYTKRQVRKMAEDYELVTADKEESQDVCFLEGRNYRDFINDQMDRNKIEKGFIKTKDGRILGEHSGLLNYTIGQREKLGISVGHPLYVIDKDVHANTLVVGSESENLISEFMVHDVNWCSGAVPDNPVKADVKIRYRHSGASATVTAVSADEAQIQFDKPQPSVTPGQSAVFYDDEIVLGGGVISSFNGKTGQ